MTKFRFLTLTTLTLTGLAAAGCQQQTATNPKKTGTYSAARHNQIGSHIPQAYSADSVDATVDNDAFMRDQQRMNNTNGSIGGNGGGVGGR